MRRSHTRRPTGVAGEDSRGTFTVSGAPAAGTRKLLSYVPVAGNYHGVQYVCPHTYPTLRGAMPMPDEPVQNEERPER